MQNWEFKAVQRSYQTEYKYNSASSTRAVKNVVFAFKNHWDNKKIETYQQKNQLKIMIGENRNFSTRKASSALQYSHTLIFIVLHDNLHLKPYKFYNSHVIKEHNYFCGTVFFASQGDWAIHDHFWWGVFWSHST